MMLSASKARGPKAIAPRFALASVLLLSAAAPALAQTAPAAPVTSAPAQATPAQATPQTIGDVLRAPAPKEDPVLGRAGTVEVRRSEVVRALEGLPAQVQQMPVATVLPLVIDRMLDGKLLAVAARAKKLEQDAEVKKRVADYEDRVLQEIYLQREVEAKIDDKELKAKYDAFLKDNPPQEEIRARHILVAAEQAAKDIIAELKKGGDFAAIARSKSTDGTARDGGDLGFFTKEDMVPEFSAAAFGLKAGEFSQIPVKTQFGFHVIKVEQRRTTQPPSFDDLKDQLKADLSQEKITDVVEALRKDKKIERFDLDGKPLEAPKP